MVKRILDYFVSPISSNYENDITRRWLGIIFAAVVHVLLIYAGVVLVLRLEHTDLYFVMPWLVVFVILGILLRKGHIRLASGIFCLCGLIAQLLASYYYGGVRSPSYTALILVIGLSTLFLRGKIIAFITGASILVGFWLLSAELGGSYQAEVAYLTPFQAWLSNTLMFLLVAIVLGSLSRQVRLTFQRVADEIEGRQATEEALREKTNFLTALHETTLAIMNRRELIPLLDSILSHAEKLVKTEQSYINLRLPGRDDVTQMVGHGLFASLNGASIVKGFGASGTALVTGETLVVNDYPGWENHIPLYAEAGVRAIMAVPMKLGDEVLGVIGLAHSETDKKFTEAEAKLLEQFAELTALALDNAQLYEGARNELAERKRIDDALKSSEENLRLALESARMGTWEWDLETNAVAWSGSVSTILGMPVGEYAYTVESYLNIVHPEDRQALLAQVKKSLANPEQNYLLEYRVLGPDGSAHWVEGKGKVYVNEMGRPRRMAGIITEITARKDAEQALRLANEHLRQNTTMLERRSTLLQVATEVSRAASAILDPTRLSQRVVDLVWNRFGLYYVGLFLMDKKQEYAVLRAATGEAGRAMLKNKHKLRVGDTSMIGWCVAHRKPRIALDVGEEAVRFNNPLLPRTRSELALPLITRGTVLGALSIQSVEEAAFSTEDIATFQALADQLANAIMNARLYEQLQRELEERKRAEEEVRRFNLELEERVQARTADLLRSEETFRALTESNPLRIRRYDREGRFLYSNRAGRDDSTSPENVVGKTVREVIQDQELAEMAERCIRQVFETGKPMNTEYQLGDSYASWWLAPEFGPDGSVISVVTSTLDITERRLMEEKLRQSSAELEATNRELEAFSYSVSHDLRAPLRSIDGFSRILVQDFSEQLPAQAKSFLKRISDSSLHMGQLIEDLLRLSRITRAELHENTVNLSLLAQSILDELKMREPEREIRFRIEADLHTKGDERLLRVALENLLNNAWKFTGKSAEAEIQVGKQAWEGETVFFIRDNGVGFDMQYVDKLFGAFQRLHSGDEFPGTGIGLAIVQRVIHKHGGRIWAEASRGQGATFYFTL